MKRTITLLASLALVASGLQIVPAGAAAPAAAAGEIKFFLGSTGCSAADVNFDFLTTTDADDEIECFYTAAGLRYEIGNQTGTVEAQGQRPLAGREDATRYFDSIDGGPVRLDATRPVTGTIFTGGGQCPVGGVCAPAGASLGEVVLDLTMVGRNGEEVVELGTQTDTFQVAPGDPHATEVKIQPDAALSGQTFEAVELQVWVHGPSAGHGVIKTTGDYSSFISVPTAAAGKTPPGKNPVPGKKKGAGKGKGKKRGYEGPGKKAPKPGKPSAQCAPFTPGEAGADKPTVVLTDAATEAAPVEQKVTVDASAADAAPVTEAYAVIPPAHDAFNIQVDSAAAESGLYALVEFEDRNDIDMNLLHPDGSYAAQSRGFNTLVELVNMEFPVFGPIFTSGHGGETTASSEKLVGIRTSDCGGWTLDVANYLGMGGELTVKLWLGEAVTDPLEEGAETP
ncbi:MAG TPA: hypothetical protein VJ927_09990 [Actinomycetota bacterium]|nr:hypothetical protein [Actinomycetota bacterium]